MNSISLFLAQIDAKDALLVDLHKTGASRSGLTLLFGACGAVTLLLLAWAIFIRKRPVERLRRFSYSSDPASKDNPGASTATSQGRRRRRRRRRSRNPSLAETGGLPPIRTEGYFEDPP
jgi:hypothetical protein